MEYFTAYRIGKHCTEADYAIGFNFGHRTTTTTLTPAPRIPMYLILL